MVGLKRGRMEESELKLVCERKRTDIAGVEEAGRFIDISYIRVAESVRTVARIGYSYQEGTTP